MARARRHQLSRARVLFRCFHGENFFPIGPIAILDPQSNRRPDRLPVSHSGENLRRVLFNLLPPAASIAKLAPAQFVIDELHVNRQLRWQPGNKRQQRLSMRFTRGVKAKHPRSFLARVCTCWIQNQWKTNSVAAAALRVQRAPGATSLTLRITSEDRGLEWADTEVRQAGIIGGWVAATGPGSEIGVIRLASTRKLHYSGPVASGVSPLTRYRLFDLRFKFLCTKDDE